MAYITTRLYSSPYGNLILGSIDDALCLCNWQNKNNKEAVNSRLIKHLNAEFIDGSSPVLKQTATQLNEYFSKERIVFDVPLLMAGTDFQKQVWTTLKTIEYGQTISYLALAKRLSKPSAVRAVANANAANALSIIIPCHRIIGHNGKLLGYAGGMDTKQHLLEQEQTS